MTTPKKAIAMCAFCGAEFSYYPSAQPGKYCSVRCRQKDCLVARGKRLASDAGDLTGQVFGRLTVLGPHFTDKKSNHWMCVCECGNISIARRDHLLKGNHKSCGCLRDEAAARRRVPHEFHHRSPESCAKDLYNTYRREAKIRGFDFALTFDEFKHLTSQNCTYCGHPPELKHTPKIKGIAKWKISGGYLYNGIDRIDSSIGYISANSTPCCARCNRAKLDYSVQEFKEWVARVYHHLYCQSTTPNLPG